MQATDPLYPIHQWFFRLALACIAVLSLYLPQKYVQIRTLYVLAYVLVRIAFVCYIEYVFSYQDHDRMYCTCCVCIIIYLHVLSRIVYVLYIGLYRLYCWYR